MHGTALRCRATGLARLPVPLNLSTLSTLSTPKTYQYIKNFFLFSSISSVVCADSVDTLFFYLNHNALCSDFSDPDRSPQPPFTFPLHQPLPVGVSADRGGVAAGVADRLIEHRADAGDVLLIPVGGGSLGMRLPRVSFSCSLRGPCSCRASKNLLS